MSESPLHQVTLYGRPIGKPVYADEILDMLAELCSGFTSRASKRRACKARRRARLRKIRHAKLTEDQRLDLARSFLRRRLEHLAARGAEPVELSSGEVVAVPELLRLHAKWALEDVEMSDEERACSLVTLEAEAMAAELWVTTAGAMARWYQASSMPGGLVRAAGTHPGDWDRYHAHVEQMRAELFGGDR